MAQGATLLDGLGSNGPVRRNVVAGDIIFSLPAGGVGTGGRMALSGRTIGDCRIVQAGIGQHSAVKDIGCAAVASQALSLVIAGSRTVAAWSAVWHGMHTDGKRTFMATEAARNF